MSERRKALSQGSLKKPLKKYIEWSSEDKCFRYYDNEKKENVLLSLPIEFIALDSYTTIKGWCDSEKSGIYSNEVKDTSKEELVVKTFNAKTVARGLYQDIKPSIEAAGGRFTRSLYAILNGETVNFQLKGATLASFMNVQGSRMMDEKLSVTEFEEGKKGSVTYTTPIFTFSGSLSKAESDAADAAFIVLENALKGGATRTDSASVSADVKEDDFSDFN